MMTEGMRGARFRASIVATCLCACAWPTFACKSEDASDPSPLDGGDETLADGADGDDADDAISSDVPKDDAAGDGSLDGGCGKTVDPTAFDLDGDGVRETRLVVKACAATPTSSCLSVTDSAGAVRELLLTTKKTTCSGSLSGATIEAIGDYNGGWSEIALASCEDDGKVGAPVLRVIDVQKLAVLARVSAPVGQKNAWIDALRDPSGKLHPFLAPSYGDADPVDPTYGAGSTWGYLCAYMPDRAADTTRCAAGFVSLDTRPAASWFREVGGYTQDLDGDGWEDVNVIFHEYVLAASVATGKQLGVLQYDVATITEPSSPKWFHSGRNYGSHSAIKGADGKLRTVEIGATPVGTFTDYNCNVSRFLAVLESSAGSPGTRRLAWSRYVGFASSIFSAYSSTYAADPSGIVTRLGNMTDRCLHRFSDGRTTIDGREALIYDIFHGKTVDSCLKIQYALYIGDPADPDPDLRPWSAKKQKAWADCQLANLKARGTWAMEAVAEVDGVGITGSTGTYVWGASRALLPSGEAVYLVELTGGETAFDLSDRAPSKLQVYALVKGLWTARGSFPVAGRPLITTVAAAHARGMGAYSYYAELTLEDRDCDGLPEVKLEGGTWVGWSKSAGDFVVKAP